MDSLIYGTSRRTYILVAKVFLIALLGFGFYIKRFSDELLHETVQSATVLEVHDITGSGVGANSSRVKIQLEDGAKANTFVRVNVPSVGQQIQVNVKTYESGSRQVSAMDYY